MRHGTTCDMCVEFEESGMGPGRCRWAATVLRDKKFPQSIIATRDGAASADNCGHFEMSQRGIDLCEEYGVRPGVDFPGTLHAGADVPKVNVGVVG